MNILINFPAEKQPRVISWAEFMKEPNNTVATDKGGDIRLIKISFNYALYVNKWSIQIADKHVWANERLTVVHEDIELTFKSK